MAKSPTKKSPRPADELVQPVSRPLEQNELDRVSGGKVVMTGFSFTKKMDKSSPQ